jgi:hypothetical protein
MPPVTRSSTPANTLANAETDTIRDIGRGNLSSNVDSSSTLRQSADTSNPTTAGLTPGSNASGEAASIQANLAATLAKIAELEAIQKQRDELAAAEARLATLLANSQHLRYPEARPSATGTLSLPLRRAPKSRELKIYKGKSIKEAHDWFYDAELKWREDQDLTWTTDAAKITHCVSAFEGVPKEIWRRKERAEGIDNMLWEDFVDFMKDSISDPANRNMDALTKHNDARQRDNQTVHSFVTYLDTQEDELGITDDFQKRNNFLAKLRPEIRRKIDDSMDIPRSREALIALAVRMENNINRYRKSRDRTNGDSNKERRRSRSPRSENRDRGSRPPYQGSRSLTNPNSAPLGTRRVADITCYKCSRKGHYASKCPSGFSDRTCYNCNQAGHISTNCPQPKKSGNGGSQP